MSLDVGSDQTPTSIPLRGTLRLDRISLVLGVAGDGPTSILGERALRERLGVRLDEFTKRFRATPLVVFSALEPGPETIAAELAIERGIPVIACLPDSPDAAEARLPGAERERFRRALAGCTRIDRVAGDGDVAARAAHVALFIAYHSHLVIACSTQGHGSSRAAAVVNVRMQGVFPHAIDFSGIPYLPDVGPVFRVIVPAGDAPAQPADERWLFPVRFHRDRQSQRDFWASLESLDRYNRDISGVRRPEGFAPGIEGLRQRTSVAANDLQHKTLAALIGLYLAALLAAAVQVLAGSRGELLKLGTLAIAFAFYWLTRRRDVENRYQDYRALSEGLRVQSVWSGIGLPVTDVEHSYLRMQQSELQWLRLALRYASLLAGANEETKGSRDLPAWQRWVRQQWRYYYYAARREAATLRGLRLATRATFAIAGLVTLLAAAVLFVLPHAPLANLPWLHPLLVWSEIDRNRATLGGLATVPIAMASAVAILVGHYCDKRGFELNVKRYERMFIVFDRAIRELHLIATKRAPGDAHKVVRELGEAALVEHADWLLTRRERPWSFVGS